MNWNIEIEKAENGFIAWHWEEREGEKQEYVKINTVFEAGEGEHGEHEAIIHLCFYLLDFFGLSGSKHDKKRIRIELEENKNGG